MQQQDLLNNEQQGAATAQGDNAAGANTTDSQAAEYSLWADLSVEEMLFTIFKRVDTTSAYLMDKVDALDGQVRLLTKKTVELQGECLKLTADLSSTRVFVEKMDTWLPRQLLSPEMRKLATPEIIKLLFTDSKCPVASVADNGKLIVLTWSHHIPIIRLLQSHAISTAIVQQGYLESSPLGKNEKRLAPFLANNENEALVTEMCSVAREALNQGRKNLKSQVYDEKIERVHGKAPLQQWAKVVAEPHRLKKWRDDEVLRARYAKLRMVKDLPKHCGTGNSNVPSALGTKKRKVGDSAGGSKLTAAQLVDKTTDSRFLCGDEKAAEELLAIVATLSATKESFWAAYVQLVEWLAKYEVTDEALLKADKAVYDPDPATPQIGGAAASAPARSSTPAVPGPSGSESRVAGSGTVDGAQVDGAAPAPATPTPSGGPVRPPTATFFRAPR